MRFLHNETQGERKLGMTGLRYNAQGMYLENNLDGYSEINRGWCRLERCKKSGNCFPAFPEW